ncbi:MAG: hypothetical protein AB7O57_08630 [Hyphomicrobiaceae bacterium]
MTKLDREAGRGSRHGMERQETPLRLERFETLLDAFGSDLGRWPPDLARRARPLLDVSAEARRLLGEARALDRLLAVSPEPHPGGLSRLADRIASVAAGGSVPEELASDRRPARSAGRGRVIPLPVRKSVIGSHAKTDGSSLKPPPRPLAAPADWRVAAALAASLLLGVGIGFTDVAPIPAGTLASLTAPSGADAESMNVSAVLDGLNMLEEDQL